MSPKFIAAKEVPALIKDGSNVALQGFLGALVPEEIYKAISTHYEEHKAPKDLTVLFSSGIGDGKELGFNHFAHQGLLKRIVAGHYGLFPKVVPQVINNEVEAYNFPQGVISQMFREIAQGKPYHFSKVGLGTFVDPDISGGKLNEKTTEDLVSKVKFDDQEYLAFKTMKLDACFLRGTYADEKGNISFDEEALILESTQIAMATKISGGKVFVQVKRVVKEGSLDPRLVKIPSLLVDYIIEVEDDNNHKQTYAETFDSDFITSKIVPSEHAAHMSLNERKIIARRCAMLIPEGAKIVNYGIGIPEGISLVLKEEGINSRYSTTIEPGTFGGVPLGGMNFGAAISPDCIIEQPTMFDFYDGGGIDVAFLGLAECDKTGNINVSKFGPKIAGCGGFINITQNTHHVIFCGTFKAGGLKIHVEDGKLVIDNEGKASKFVDAVEQITFSGKTALSNDQHVYYVTERAVFKLVPEGVELLEIAPGIDLEKDVLAHMSFRPIMKDVKLMDERIFKDEKMHLK